MATELIRAVIATLNSISVRGKEDLDSMLGCINALESVVAAAEVEEVPNGGSSDK